MSYTATGHNATDISLQLDPNFVVAFNAYTHYGIYRAHATETGHHLSNELYSTNYNNGTFSSFNANTQWNDEPKHLSTVFRHSGAGKMLETSDSTAPATYNRNPIYDCPPPSITGYRYIAYAQIHFIRPGGEPWGVILLTNQSPIHKLPTIKQTSKDALFIYYTYQYNDILRGNKNLRNTLLRPLLPADYTDEQITATMTDALSDKANDGCGIYSCNDTPAPE